MLPQNRYDAFKKKCEDIKEITSALAEVRFTPKSEVNEYLIQLGYEPLHEGISALELIKRPNVTLKGLKPFLSLEIEDQVAKQIEIEAKYEGYIRKAKKEAERLQAMDKVKLINVNYDEVENLSLEGRQKLSQLQPFTLGQASRISGVNPADIAVLAVYLKQRSK